IMHRDIKKMASKLFLMGRSIDDHVQQIVTKVGPLTAIQEQQHFGNLKYASVLPVVLCSTDPCQEVLKCLSCFCDHLYSFPKKLEEMVQQDQPDPLIMEQEVFPPSQAPGAQPTLGARLDGWLVDELSREG
ncbi:hypothetical protein NHX12_002792, partial [Muraenolepis orangiensis]